MMHRLAAAFVALSATLIGATGASAMAPYVVVDVSSGRVLMAEDATVPWYPASVTKLMTTYVTLRQLKAGAIGLETPIPVSARAASVAPSKIGVKPGQEVTLDNALKMMLVKSANDMAVVIAEGVGGTIENFADMMNREAERLGMRESHFVNPNGLFVEGQQTSARDLAILARALLNEFPDYDGYFSIGALQLGKRVLKNTNGLIGRYPGIEGMKTGFICASGFNLVALARRNGQRLIAVVLGASSNADRTLRAAEMLDKGFSRWGSSAGSLEALAPSGIAEPPNMREDICVRRKGPAPSEEEAESASVVPSNSGDDGRVLPGGVPFMNTGSSIRGPGGPRSLIARAEFDPIPVSIGRTPGSAMAPMAANSSGALGAKSTATAYAGDKKVIDPTVTPVSAAIAGSGVPLDIKPTPNQLTLSPAGRGKAGAPKTGALPGKTVPVGKTAKVETQVDAKGDTKVTAPGHGRLRTVITPAHPPAKTAAKPGGKPGAKAGAKPKPVASMAKPAIDPGLDAPLKPLAKPGTKTAAKPAPKPAAKATVKPKPAADADAAN
jgi:D-alanyl-D-alanine carboxypeptidase